MAFNIQNILAENSLIVILLFVLAALTNSHFASSCFTRIFSFGDSNSDTGNYLQILGDNYHYMRYLPYGETYFGYPTGRFCDGRLIIDFFAQEFGLPFLTAYLKGNNSKVFLSNGVNFATGGATAIESSFFRAKGIRPNFTDESLDVQVQWFKQLLPSMLKNSGSRDDILRRSLFVVGVIGGNDYNGALLMGRSFDEVETFVPLVIQRIVSSIQELIGLGAKTLLVPGNFPLGCSPSYLTFFRSPRKEDYNPKTGCLNWLNEFAGYHNRLLMRELDKLRRIHSNVMIIYADFFGATMSMYQNPQKFGFKNPLMACCGGEGPYNYDKDISCGYHGSTLCPNPSNHVSWDGVHLTEAAYEVVTNEILYGAYTYPSFANVCKFLKRDLRNILYSRITYSA